MASEATVVLNSTEDWEKWLARFKAQAFSLSLWDHINHGQALKPMPVVPVPATYSRAQQAQATPAPNTRSQTAEAEGSQTAAPAPPPPPVTAIDLTAAERSAYQLDLQAYTFLEKEHIRQAEAVQKLKKWVMENTGSHYFLVACDPETTLATWYEKLHEHVGVSTAQAKEKARKAYKIAILKLKNPKDWKKWLKA